MVLTKLLNVRTFQLEQYDFESLPPYVAISHVWTDELYPPEYINSITATQPLGMKMIMSAFEHEDLQKVRHCWIDSWCIDQKDEADKKLQIPRMDTIYRKAEAMAITVKHIFSFTQQDWNEVMHELRDDLHWYDSEYMIDSSDGLRLQKFVANPHANRAMDYIIEIAGLHWNRRIWTAQEFILAQNAFWVAGNLRRLQADDWGMQITHQMFITAGSTDKNRANYLILNNLQFTNTIRSGYRKPQEIMQLARYRESQHETDQIYGLMAASEVIITPRQKETLDEAWRRWWEAAIEAGHLLFALLPTLRDHNIPLSAISPNCIMPPVGVRTECIGRARLRDVQAMVPATLNRGTLKAWGRREGLVKIDLCLGKDAEIPSKITELLDFYRRSSVMTERFLLAISASYNDSRKTVSRIMRRLREFALLSDNKDINGHQVQDDIDKTYASWFSGLRVQFSREFPGNLYLGTINTGKQKIDILIPSTDPIPQGLLLALDFHALDLYASLPGTSDSKRLMIVQSSGDKKSPGRALHKINMALPILYWESEELYESYGHEEIALWSHGKPIRQFSIGGDACSYCRSCREGSNKILEIPCIWDMPGRGSITSMTGDKKRKESASLPTRYSKRTVRIPC